MVPAAPTWSIESKITGHRPGAALGPMDARFLRIS
jgi:hypothetical protein